MLEVLQFLFGDFWHWLGLFLLVGAAGGFKCTENHYHNHKPGKQYES